MYNIEYLQTLKHVNCATNVFPSIIPDMSIFESIGHSLVVISKFFGAVIHYCLHPLLFIRDVTILVAKCSYCVCLFGSMWCLIIYIFTDDDKYLKKAKINVVAYVILQILGGCLQGVLK